VSFQSTISYVADQPAILKERIITQKVNIEALKKKQRMNKEKESLLKQKTFPKKQQEDKMTNRIVTSPPSTPPASPRIAAQTAAQTAQTVAASNINDLLLPSVQTPGQLLLTMHRVLASMAPFSDALMVAHERIQTLSTALQTTRYGTVLMCTVVTAFC
jgi:hypothetical protein